MRTIILKDLIKECATIYDLTVNNALWQLDNM